MKLTKYCLLYLLCDSIEEMQDLIALCQLLEIKQAYPCNYDFEIAPCILICDQDTYTTYQQSCGNTTNIENLNGTAKEFIRDNFENL